MIELKNDALRFTFPEVHESARVTIDFQRTLRIPDDDKTYLLPPGLGRFPVRHVDDHASKVPAQWLEHGGVMLPMYQSEALWINFGHAERHGDFYPCAVKIATGKIDVVTGKRWRNELSGRPQDYVTVPPQPWLDGYCVKKGVIRQFVAMPLGSGYSAEEQITGAAEHGGLQIVVYPMKYDFWQALQTPRSRCREVESMMPMGTIRALAVPDMGLSPGGQMHQSIHSDIHGPHAWDQTRARRCFVHLANSLVWSSITGSKPPHPAPTAREYTDAGLPWFRHYDDSRVLHGSTTLKDLEGVAERGERLGQQPLPENESVTPKNIVHIRANLRQDQVREWRD